MIYSQVFYLGHWQVSPVQNKLKYLEKEIYIEPKLMQVLVYLCSNAPDVISNSKLIESCWNGQYVSDNPLHKCIAQLRKVLGDTVKNPQYINHTQKRVFNHFRNKRHS